jgi:hypothetical protein
MKRFARRRLPLGAARPTPRERAYGSSGAGIRRVVALRWVPHVPHRAPHLMARAFLVRGLLAAAGLVALARLDATGVAAVLAWAAIVLAVGTEVLASVVFLLRRR